MAWLLLDNVKTKNQFAKNRILDIHKMKKELLELCGIPLHLKYVPTYCNPADMLTRGLSLEILKSKLEFWLKSPEWLNSVNVKWPVSELSCLNSVSKSILLNTNLVKVKGVTPLVPFDKFSKLSKLVRVTTLVIKALSKFKCLKSQTMKKLWGTTDISQCAKVHLIQVMQKQSFSNEIEFLRDVRNEDVPELVNKWNLFIDEDGLVRSDGKI